jgi:hypothetical protein
MTDFYRLNSYTKVRSLKSYNSIVVKKSLALLEEREKRLKTEGKVVNLPPYEGSLQQRSYPKVIRITKEQHYCLDKINRIVKAYRDVLNVEKAILKSDSYLKHIKHKRLQASKSVATLRRKVAESPIKERSISRSPSSLKQRRMNESKGERQNTIESNPDYSDLTAWETSE